jgi:alpha-ketoglutaric semialdehyde dehydrogenase
MKLSGQSLIGFRAGSATKDVFHATNARTGERLEPSFSSASAEEVDAAAVLANEAFAIYSRATGREKAAFLRAIAANIEAIAPEIIERAEQETALPKARLQGETARTCGQLRLFARSVSRLPSRTSVPCSGPWDPSWSSAPATFPWPFPWPAEIPLPP